jgi:hypothetical protein
MIGMYQKKNSRYPCLVIGSLKEQHAAACTEVDPKTTVINNMNVDKNEPKAFKNLIFVSVR